ncbi:cysteine proteinase [Anaeromyces robustus]|uniref:ubiquitinyl hydrolase 1 n=1 Tax=Anaeromyces robustus TaxID=1754192 RepID=A0A1Y1XPL0_9FUNG|nr:cysteine proteinase [Anaeromyces robustus]|eukprot:ORX87688.1 cysteine proteinase [Anaeromyces robustus]
MNKDPIPILPKDTSYLDKELGSGCYYKNVEILDKKVYTWTIPQWSVALDREKLFSKTFEVGGCKWKLLLFPKGVTRNNIVSVFLYSVNANDENCPQSWYACSHFGLALANPYEKKIFIKKEAHHRFTTKENDWGFQQFIKTNDLYKVRGNTGKSLIENDTLSVIAYIRVIKDTTGVLWYDFSEWDSKKRTGYVGLKNQGATCYMNSLLQSLYFIKEYRKATFEIPTEKEQPCNSVPLALQRVFYNLQHSNSSVDTRELTNSFGWDTVESFMQHDIQEFNRVLQDNLEDKMKKTKAEGAISNIFKGKMKSYIKCINVDYTSSRVEDYYDIQLNVKGCKNVIQSFDEYIDVETLEGENKYMAEGYGLQDAQKGVIFQSFPPVLQLHLKRFEYDFEHDAMVKNNDRFEYPEILNLSKYLENYNNEDLPENDYILYGVLVHSGDINSGHYCAFIRPKNNDKWYKFDDDNVFPVSSYDVFEENFGGKSIYKSNSNITNRYTNAYMLIYIRKSEIDTILAPFSEDDIPKHIGERITKEQEELKKRKEQLENERKSLIIHILTDEIISHHPGFDLCNINHSYLPLTTIPGIQILKTATFKEFIDKVQSKYRYSKNHFRLWEINYRPNETFRVSKVVQCQDENKKMEEIFKPNNEYYHGPIIKYLYMEIADPNNLKSYNEPFLPLELYPNQCLVFLKYFDIHKKKLTIIQKFTIEDIEKPLIHYVPLFNEIADLPVNTSLNIYEETYPSMIDLLNQNHSLKKLEIVDGDILCFEKKYSDNQENKKHTKNQMIIPQYFDKLLNQKIVTFINLSQDEETKIDDVHLTLYSDTTYKEMSEMLGDRIQQDPENFQFITYSTHQQIRYLPNNPLDKFLEPNENVLFYTILSIPLKEYENIIIIPVDELTAKHQIKKSHNVMIYSDATYRDLYESIYKELGYELLRDAHGNYHCYARKPSDYESKELDIKSKGKEEDEEEEDEEEEDDDDDSFISCDEVLMTKRIYCTCENRVLTIIKPDDYMSIRNHPRDVKINYYVEDIPLTEQNKKSESNKLVSAVYFDKIIENLHGIPFPFEINENETYGDLKKRLFKNISLSNKELNEENVYLVNKDSQLLQYDDDDVPDEYVAIGYDCPDRTLMHFLSDKGLKINS